MGDCVNVKLREIRARYRVSQEKLARAVGVTRQTIIAIEAGKYLPSLTLALKIASYFNLHVEEIFTLTDKCRPSRGDKEAGN
ncbi:MAG: helix-turn-helix transcriptional regulator [Desulfurococcales archaeon]|nr:helix-turn-helix transcriptional regulator [Desulfurococcales archaeon]